MAGLSSNPLPDNLASRPYRRPRNQPLSIRSSMGVPQRALCRAATRRIQTPRKRTTCPGPVGPTRGRTTPARADTARHQVKGAIRWTTGIWVRCASDKPAWVRRVILTRYRGPLLVPGRRQTPRQGSLVTYETRTLSIVTRRLHQTDKRHTIRVQHRLSRPARLQGWASSRRRS